jgi:mRNA-degrading endonuclease RelE of RelBE toxin-antitoxin system
MYKVILVERANKEFGKLSRELQQKVYQKLVQMEKDPFALPIKKIKSTEYGYRLRVGRWRILFALFVSKKSIEVVDIFMKKGKEDYMRRLHLLK